MFEKHFHLHRRPFPSIPSSDRYFPAASIDKARAGLVRLIEREQGPGLVIGATGTGKTMLCRLLDDTFRQRYRVVRLPTGRLSSRRALLQTVMYELGQSYRDLDEGELRLALIDYATDKDLCPDGILILVDEAESLALPLMDELRTMTDLMSAGEPCIRLILFGNSRLEDKFAHPRLESFNQRIAGRFYLESLTREESRQFVEQQIRESGGQPDSILSENAFNSIHQATHGIPRLINQLCDHALILATINGIQRLDAGHLDVAWSDLQQLPMPKLEVDTDESLAPDIVEFGVLDDGDTAEVTAEAVPSSEDAPILHTLGEGDETLDDDETQDDDATNSDELPMSAEQGPEIALILHNSDATHDPFDEPFDEEEVVIDRYVTPDVISQRGQRSVSCDESRQIAGQLEGMLRDLNHSEPHSATDQLAAPAAEKPWVSTESREESHVLALTDQSTSHDPPIQTAYEPTGMVHEPIELIVESPPADETHELCESSECVDRASEAISDASAADPIAVHEVEVVCEVADVDTHLDEDDDVEPNAAPPDDVERRDTYRNLFTRLRRTHD